MDVEEVQQRAAEPIKLVDNDGINKPGFHIGQQPLQGWTGRAASREQVPLRQSIPTSSI
jgi:hypothetical protein